MVALPWCRRRGSVDGDGGGVEGASAIGSEELLPIVSTAASGGGGGVCAEHVRHRPGGLRLRPPTNPRGGWLPRQCAAAQGHRNAAENIRGQ